MMVTPESNRPDLKESACFLVNKIKGGKIVEAREINIGIMTFKFLVTLSTGQKYIVRFYPRSRSFVVQYEPDIILRCQAAGLPVPEVICDSRNGPRTELEYMIYPFINGTSLSEVYSSLEEATRMKIADDLVPLIAKISEIALEGFGELLDAQRAKLDSWSEYLEQTCHIGIVSARRYGLFSGRDIDNLESLLPELTSIPQLQSGRLVWGDISLENLIVEKDGSIAGILDFEGSLSGGHIVNLGFCHARCYGTGFFEALMRAWPERFSEDQQREIKLYSLLRALRLAKFAHLPLPTGVPSDRIINVLPGFGPALDDLLDTSIRIQRKGGDRMTQEKKNGLEMKDSQPGEENEAFKTENVEQTVTHEDKIGAGGSNKAVIKDVADSAGRNGKHPLAKYPKGDWPYKPAGFWGKLFFSLWILVIVVLVVYFWSVKFTEVKRKINSDFSIEWSAAIDGFILNPGPPSFWYDRDLKVLHHRGPIDAEIKKELINLPTYPESEDSSFRDVTNSYRESINRLAFKSTEIDIHFAVSLILLAGLSGLIGSMLRIIGDFVGWACYLYQLDLARWWPFYLLRPVMGFIIGAVTVIIFKGSMAAVFDTSGLMPSTVGIYSWIIFAFLAGFGVSDFTRMLKNLSKRIFGNE